MKTILFISLLLISYLSFSQAASINQGGTTTNIGGDLVVSGEISQQQVYANLYDSTDIVTALATTHYLTLKSWRYREYSNCTVTDSTITVLEPGLYQIYVYTSFHFSVSSKIIHVSLFVNDVETHLEIERKISTGGDAGNMGGMAILRVPDNGVLKLKGLTDGAGNMTRDHSGWVIKKLCN